MYPDVVDLREYYESDAGRLTRMHVAAACRRLWPDIKKDTLLGFGYATPYLADFVGDAQRTLAFMPAPQGVTWWPREGQNNTALVEETLFPLADCSVDRLLLVHSLENSDHMGDLLHECWRVLTPQGRMLVIAPNRNGGWTRKALSPFAFSFTFAATHLKRILRHNQFQMERQDCAVFTPSLFTNFSDKWTGWMERNGRRFIPALAGVLAVEVSKSLYPEVKKERVRMARPHILSMPNLVSPSPTRGSQT